MIVYLSSLLHAHLFTRLNKLMRSQIILAHNRKSWHLVVGWTLCHQISMTHTRDRRLHCTHPDHLPADSSSMRKGWGFCRLCFIIIPGSLARRLAKLGFLPWHSVQRYWLTPTLDYPPFTPSSATKQGQAQSQKAKVCSLMLAVNSCRAGASIAFAS